MEIKRKKIYVSPDCEVILPWSGPVMVNASVIHGKTDQDDLDIGWGGDNDDDDVPTPTANSYSWDDLDE